MNNRLNSEFKASAVLVLITKELCEGNLILTKRSEDLKHHGGEISFPGGVKDFLDEDLKETALRETFEEVNINRDQINIIDQLPDTSTSTGYLIKPYVGILKRPFQFVPNSSEVSDVLQIPISLLARGDCDRAEALLMKNDAYMTKPLYAYEGNVIFGATARIMSNLVLKIKQDCTEQ